MIDSEQLEPEDGKRREKINQRLVIFGILVVLLSLAWHVGAAFFFGEKFGNPHSQHHYGWEASDPIELARDNIASLINAHSKEIIFTSGATESNNLAIKGIAHFFKGEKRHLITCVTEHKCVLEAFQDLQKRGVHKKSKMAID